jgi:hypothetical protein
LAYGVKPALDLDGTDDMVFVASRWDGGDELDFWRITTSPRHPPISNLPAYTRIPVAPYSIAPDAEQPTATKVFSGYADIASAVRYQGRAWVAHTIACVVEGIPNDVACTHFYEIDAATGALLDDGLAAIADGHLFFPALLPGPGDVPLIVFNASGPSRYVSVGFMRLDDDLWYSAAEGAACVGADEGSAAWGDRTAVAIDPLSGTVWAHGAYAGPVECDQFNWIGAVFEIDWDEATPYLPTPTPRPGTSDPSAGLPITVNRDMPGVWAGGGRFRDRMGAVGGHADTGIQIQNLHGQDTTSPEVTSCNAARMTRARLRFRPSSTMSLPRQSARAERSTSTCRV